MTNKVSRHHFASLEFFYKIDESQSVSKYIKALKALISSTGIKKNALHKKGLIDRNVLNKMLKTTENPEVSSIEKYLFAYGLNWDDWAKEMKAMSEAGHGKPKKKPPRRVSHKGMDSPTGTDN